MLECALSRLYYIDFIDRVYILQSCIISKRVEGNAGQILDEAPKNKPYFAYEGRIFSAFKLAIILITFMYCKAFSYSNA